MTARTLFKIAMILITTTAAAHDPCITIEVVTENLVIAGFCAKSTDSAVSHYKASIVGDPALKCHVLAGAEPASCIIRNLSEHTHFWLKGQACLPKVGSTEHCADLGTVQFTTKLQGPTCILESSPNPTTLDVSVCSTSQIADVDVYEVSTTAPTVAKCSIDIANGDKVCQLQHLAGGTEYKGEVRACRVGKDAVCSEPTVDAWATMPNEPACFKATFLPSETKIEVEVCRPDGNPALDGFEVRIVGGTASQICRIVDDKAPSKKCSIAGLKPRKTYTVEARTCVGWAQAMPACSTWISLEVTASTTPTTSTDPPTSTTSRGFIGNTQGWLCVVVIATTIFCV